MNDLAKEVSQEGHSAPRYFAPRPLSQTPLPTYYPCVRNGAQAKAGTFDSVLHAGDWGQLLLAGAPAPPCVMPANPAPCHPHNRASPPNSLPSAPL